MSLQLPYQHQPFNYPSTSTSEIMDQYNEIAGIIFRTNPKDPPLPPIPNPLHYPLLWVVLPTTKFGTRSHCPGAHPTWTWTTSRMGHPEPSLRLYIYLGLLLLHFIIFSWTSKLPFLISSVSSLGEDKVNY